MLRILAFLSKKSLPAFLIAFFILANASFAQDSPKNGFINATLQVMDLEDYKTREIMDIRFSSPEEEEVKINFSLKVNSVNHLHKREDWHYNSSRRVGMKMSLDLSRKMNDQEEMLLKMEIEGIIESILKNDELYFKLTDFKIDYDVEEEGGVYLGPQIQPLLELIQSHQDAWFKLSVNEMEQTFLSPFYSEAMGLDSTFFGENEPQTVFEDYLKKVLKDKKDWKEGLVESMEALLTQQTEDLDSVSAEEMKTFLDLFKQTLDSQLFLQRNIEIGMHKGSKSFVLNKISLVEVMRNLNLLFYGGMDEVNLMEFKKLLSNVFLMGRYRLNENGPLNYFLTHFKVRNTENIKELTVNYGYKVWGEGIPNNIQAPANAKSFEALETMFTDGLGLAVSDD